MAVKTIKGSQEEWKVKEDPELGRGLSMTEIAPSKRVIPFKCLEGKLGLICVFLPSQN